MYIYHISTRAISISNHHLLVLDFDLVGISIDCSGRDVVGVLLFQYGEHLQELYSA